MGTPNYQTEAVRTIALLVLLLVFGLLADPLLLWVALIPLGVGLGEVYAGWLFLFCLGITATVLRQLLVDQDATPPFPTRKIGRIT